MSDSPPNTEDLIRPPTARAPLLLTSSRLVAPAAKPTKESLPLTVLRGLGRRWRMAVVLGAVLATAAGTAAWFLVPPPMPTAASKLYIPQKLGGKLGGEHPDPPLERSTQPELIRSHRTLSAALNAPDVANLPILKAEDDPLDWLSKKLTVEYLGAEVLRISLTHNDPEQAKIIVQAVTDAYLMRVVNKAENERRERLKRYNDYAGEYKEVLRRQRESIRVLAKDGGLYDTEKQVFLQNQIRLQMSDAQRQLIRAESDLRAGRAKERYLAAEGNAELSENLLDAFVDADRRVQDSALLLKQTQEHYERTLKAAKTPEVKAVKDIEAKLATLKLEHEGVRTRVRDGVKASALTQSKSGQAVQLQKVQADNAILEGLVAALKGELDSYATKLVETRVMNAEVAPLQFEVGLTEKQLGAILQAALNLKIEQEAPARVELMEPATIIRVDAEKRKRMLTAGGSLAGFLVALGLVGLFESRFRRVESADAVPQQLGLRLVGTVPTPKAGTFKWFANSDAQTTAVLTEAIASTRTMLLHGEGSSAHRVLLVTSPVSGEGKTSLSVQLGVSIALAGHKTLIIDGDLRNPTAHERLGVANRPGLCELLRGEAALLEVVRETSVAGLDMIPAGRWTPETAQALATSPLSQLFEMWREQYEFVILDSSPVLPVTDALLFARHVDGVILSLLQGVSRVSQAAEVCERFTSLGVNVIGAIVNGTSAKSYGGSEKYYTTPVSSTERV